MTAHAGPLSRGAVDLQVRAARPVRRVGQRTAAAHGEDRRRHLLHQIACTPRPSITIRRSRSSRPALQLAGRPSIGAWLSYGLGSENKDLPAFVVHDLAGQRQRGQPLYDRLWGSGFLPTKYQGVKFRSGGDPVLYLSNPAGFTRRRPAALPRRSRQAERHDAATISAIRRSPRASRSTRWRTGCKRRCPS